MKNSELYYTNERNVQIVIALLKAHGIHRVIASPGTTNMTFVVSIQNDPWFQMWSSVDERSAAYLACGMAAETGEPVVISCTGATASRNYMPGLTEAYYRKLPVLAITSTRGVQHIGHLRDQQIDRRQRPSDIVMESVSIPMVKDKNDERYCEIEVNKALLALFSHGGGPSHINLYTGYSRNFNVTELPHTNVINRHTVFDSDLPTIPVDGRVAVVIGSHLKCSERLTNAIDKFCSTYNAAVFCDHTSGYRGKYEVHYQVVSCQENYRSELLDVHLAIHIGEVSGDQYGVRAKHVWRVSEDGALRDTWRTLRRVFEMSETHFFEKYGRDGFSNCEYYRALKNELQGFYDRIPELPFGNIWIAQTMAGKLPEGCGLHLGIYNSLRSWNFFNLPQNVYAKCNVGGFGIDGGISSLIGASFTNPDKIFIGVFGDLAFFYDMNVIGNRHVGKNVRVLIINNGRGTEFRNYSHPCYFLGDDADQFVAAAGHYGNQSFALVKHYATDLGYEYLSAQNKEQFYKNVDRFLNPVITEKPMLFEVYTNSVDESEALRMLMNIDASGVGVSKVIKEKIISVIKKNIDSRKIEGLKMILGK